MAKVRIEQSWLEALSAEWDKPYFEQLIEFVRSRYAAGTIFPSGRNIFAAFDACPFDEVKVVILGQDPYHDYNQANGLAFSVNPGVKIPPSLVNIFKEVSADTGAPLPADGDLTRWARQGVLLLNATLTVEAHQPGSHRGKGWEQLTDAAVKILSQKRDNLVFMLWGASAGAKAALIDQSRHLVLRSPHPSPLSAHRPTSASPGGFFGNHHFSLANQYLSNHNTQPIIW